MGWKWLFSSFEFDGRHRTGPSDGSDHLAVIGQQHGGIVTGHNGGTVLIGLHDPNGIEIRLYAN